MPRPCPVSNCPSQAKAHSASTFDSRSATLKDKYTKLRRVLESSHEQGDDALAKHQAFLQDHYRTKFEEKYGSLEAQANSLEAEVAELTAEESALAAQASELAAEAAGQAAEAKEREVANKKLQADITSLHGKVGGVQATLLEYQSIVLDPNLSIHLKLDLTDRELPGLHLRG